MTFELGTAVGPYTIEEKLGQGGMATVYKAYHENLDRHVAIKVLHTAFKDNDSFLRRFKREARVVARLEHPRIVPVHDFAEQDGYPYLVMRYVEGETLKDRLSAGMLTRAEIIRIAGSIADALDYAHERGVLHRDIKPSNILLTRGGGVYITDFGLARITQAGESTLSQDMIMGTPQYISPEQAKGNVELDGRTDVYSFGIVLYEMVTGRVPFQSDTSYSIIHSQIFDPPPLPSSLNDKITPAMEEVLLKVLSKEPDDRFETAGELVSTFADVVNQMPTDMAPTGATVLPDYTPAGMTRAISPDIVPTELETPDLPDLSEAPGSEGTAVSPPTTKTRRPIIMIGLGILLGMFICGGLIFSIIFIARRNAENPPPIAAAASPAADVEDVLDKDTAGSTTSAEDQQSDSPAAENPPPTPADAEPPPTPNDAPPTAPPPTGNSPERPGAGDGGIPDISELLSRRVRPLDELEKMHKDNPDNQAVTLELGAAYMRDGQPEKAREMVSLAFERARIPVGFVMVSEQLLQQQQYEMAEIILEEANSSIWGSVITNITGVDKRRVDMVFGIGYGDSMEQAEKILHDIVT
ncbi:MAG: protein kinase, partial [Anaerolineae bacterium]